MSRLVILLLCAVCALAQDGIAPQPNVTIIPGTTTISPPTVKPTNATTTSPVPTTVKPTDPTTSATTTMKPTNPTTTTKPTTTKPTSPTPPPKPKPIEPEINNFIGNYTGNNSMICLRMTVAIQIEILNGNSSTMINVTKDVNYTASCENKTIETLKIFWDNDTVEFTFLKNNSKYDIESVVVNVSLPGGNTTLYHKTPRFSVADTQSYKCVKDQPLNLTEANSNVTFAKLHISNLQYQAFMNRTKLDYDTAWYCDATNTPDVVPVIVGCVLAVLVVLVLVAYLFGRKRWQARGYLSM